MPQENLFALMWTVQQILYLMFALRELVTRHAEERLRLNVMIHVREVLFPILLPVVRQDVLLTVAPVNQKAILSPIIQPLIGKKSFLIKKQALETFKRFFIDNF